MPDRRMRPERNERGRRRLPDQLEAAARHRPAETERDDVAAVAGVASVHEPKAGRLPQRGERAS